MIVIALEEDILLLQKNIYGDITSKGSEVLISYCSVLNRKISMTVSDNTIQAEGLGRFIKKMVRNFAEAGKKLATNVLKNPGRALKITSHNATAAATKSPKAALSSLPEVIHVFIIRVKDCSCGNLYDLCYIYRTKK